MKNIIVGMGEALWDCLPEGRKFGGAPANFAYHVGQFGWHSIVISAVGNDALGDEIMDIVRGVKLDNRIARVSQPTGTVKVTLSGDGIPSYEICENVAWDNIPWSEELEEIAKDTQAVCFGSLAQRTAVTRATVHKFLDTMPALGTLKVFDINLRQNWFSREVIEESLFRSNVLKLNDEEIVVVSSLLGLGEIKSDALSRGEALQLTDVEDQCFELISRYDLQMVILTCGTHGSYVFSQSGEVSFQQTPVVKVADTVGAGDSFTGSFCAAILAGKPVAEAHEIGVKVSAFVCTQHGAMPQYPQELLDSIK